jgi:hypothetical protein
MGMFDSIMLNVKCPHCDVTSEIECQTKDLECILAVFRKGDYIGTKKYNYLWCVADCRSHYCMQQSAKEIGYVSGFGKIFHVEVMLYDGCITGEYNIVLDDDETTRKVIVEKTK